MQLPSGLPANPTMRDVTRWAESQKAKGAEICVCAQGTVDLPLPPLLAEQIFPRAAALSSAHRYPPQIGLRDLRAAFRDHLVRKEGVRAPLQVEDPTGAGKHQGNFLVCSGVNGGVLAALHHVRERFGASADCGVLDPSYLYHDLDVLSVFGRGAVHLPPSAELGLGRAEIEAALASRRIRALVVCNPANPHGLALDEEELRWLTEITARHEAVVIFDEVYAHIGEPGQTFRSVLHLYDALPRHAIVVRGWSKLIGLQADRLACLIAHEEVLPSIIRWHDILYIGVNGVAQAAVAEYLRDHPDDLERHAAALNRTIVDNAQLMTDAFARALGWRLVQGPRVGRSTIYRMYEHDRDTDMEALLVALQRGVAAAAGNIFFGTSDGNPFGAGRKPRTGYLRLSLAMDTAQVRAGAAFLMTGKTVF